MASYRDYAVGIKRHLVEHDGDSGHGYDWEHRFGDGTTEAVRIIDKTFDVPNGDFDCSSSDITAWELACPGCTGNAVYTGNMRYEFTKTGLWSWHPLAEGFEPLPGDLYLNEELHVAMYIGDGLLAEFSGNEHGGVYGGKQGDQTGWESHITPYYSRPWDGILHFEGDEIERNDESEEEMVVEYIAWADGFQPLYVREYPNGKVLRQIVETGDDLEGIKLRYMAGHKGEKIGECTMGNAAQRKAVSKYIKSV